MVASLSVPVFPELRRAVREHALGGPPLFPVRYFCCRELGATMRSSALSRVRSTPPMRDASTLKPIGSAHCPQYNTEARFYIDAAHKSGHRHLVVHYEKGGS